MVNVQRRKQRRLCCRFRPTLSLRKAESRATQDYYISHKFAYPQTPVFLSSCGHSFALCQVRKRLLYNHRKWHFLMCSLDCDVLNYTPSLKLALGPLLWKSQSLCGRMPVHTTAAEVVPWNIHCPQVYGRYAGQARPQRT